jgi:hypothetical protein
MDQPTLYKIRVQGHQSDRWATWFDGLKIENQPGGEAVLSGPLADQAALHGVLGRIRDLGGLTLIALKRIAEDPSHGANC